MALPIIAALAAPIVGGAMTLAGGAMSLTGGVLTAGSTIAGIAADAAGGVVGAVGGLLGGGKSGNVEAPEQEQEGPKTPMGTYRDNKGVLRNDGTMKRRGTFASDPSKGMSLAKVKSSIDPLNAEGGVSMLPSGKESQVTLLSQILGQIRTNTGALFSIDAKIGGLIDAFSTPPPPPPPEPEDLIDRAQQKKGDGFMSKVGERVTSTFSALGKRLKSLSGSLAGAAKFALKGLLLTGALVLFRKYRENIIGFIARTFEKLSDFVKRFDTEDPIGSFFDRLMSTGEGSILNSLKNGITFVITELINAIKLMINDLNIPGIKFEIGRIGYDSALDENLATQAKVVGGAGNLGTVGQGMAPGKQLVFKDMGGDETQQKLTEEAVRNRLKMMYQNVVGSGGRIQWTNIGDGFQIGKGYESILKRGIAIADVMSSQPIIDGKVRNIEDLNNIDKFMPSAQSLGITNEIIQEQFRENAALLTQAKQMMTASSLPVDKKFYGDDIAALKARQLALVPTVSASNDGSGALNVINANDQSQSIVRAGDTIQLSTGAGTSEQTAINAFISTMQ